MIETDEQLLAKVAKSDQAALARLYDRMSAPVFGWLVRVVGLKAAEEILQETFLSVWGTASTYRQDLATPQTWVFLIARSRAYDLLRRSQRRPNLSELEESARLVLPDDVLNEDEPRDQLHQALALLPDEQRRPIALTFYGGQTYESVASLLNLPVETVKTRICLGMTRLRTLLNEKNSNP